MTDEKLWLDPTIRGLEALESDPEKLIQDARRKEDAFDMLCFGVAAKIERVEPLCDCVTEWACKFLRGEVDAPMRNSGTNTQSGKHRAILRIVGDLVKYGGLTASRNDTAKNKQSACDAVAWALKEKNMEPSTFEGVRNLWKKRFKTASDLFQK